MSTLVSLTQEFSTQVVQGSSAAGGGGTGILDWLTGKSAEAQSLFRALSITFGIGFIIWQAIISRGALARIVIAALAAGVFVWAVWNVTALKNRVDNEVNSLGGPASSSQVAQGSHADPFRGLTSS